MGYSYFRGGPDGLLHRTPDAALNTPSILLGWITVFWDTVFRDTKRCVFKASLIALAKKPIVVLMLAI